MEVIAKHTEPLKKAIERNKDIYLLDEVYTEEQKNIRALIIKAIHKINSQLSDYNVIVEMCKSSSYLSTNLENFDEKTGLVCEKERYTYNLWHDKQKVESDLSTIGSLVHVGHIFKKIIGTYKLEYNSVGNLARSIIVGINDQAIIILLLYLINEEDSIILKTIDDELNRCRTTGTFFEYKLNIDTILALRQHKAILGFCKNGGSPKLTMLIDERRSINPYDDPALADRNISEVEESDWYQLFSYALKHTIVQGDLVDKLFSDQSEKEFMSTLPLWIGKGAVGNKSRGKDKMQYVAQYFTGKESVPNPDKMIISPSIKLEAGLKQRLILAEDEDSFISTAYYIGGLEYSTKVRGAVMRQKPADVLEWIVQSQSRGLNHYQICIDYDNFNSQHSTIARALLHCHLCSLLSGIQAENKRQHGLGLLKRLFNTYIKNSDILIGYGLNSGERVTTLDNTLLHSVYSKMAELLSGVKCLYMRVCGDDEYAIFKTRKDAIAYYTALCYLGFKIQSRKVIFGNHIAEFLQINAIGDTSSREVNISQPIVSNVCRFGKIGLSRSKAVDASILNDAYRDHLFRFKRWGTPTESLQRLASITVNRFKNTNGTYRNSTGVKVVEHTKLNIKSSFPGYPRHVQSMMRKQVIENIDASTTSIKDEEVKREVVLTNMYSIVSKVPECAGQPAPKVNPRSHDWDRFPIDDMSRTFEKCYIPIKVKNYKEVNETYLSLPIHLRRQIKATGFYEDRINCNPYQRTRNIYKNTLPGQLASSVRI